jgi:hypothetical protein
MKTSCWLFRIRFKLLKSITPLTTKASQGLISFIVLVRIDTDRIHGRLLAHSSGGTSYMVHGFRHPNVMRNFAKNRIIRSNIASATGAGFRLQWSTVLRWPCKRVSESPFCSPTLEERQSALLLTADEVGENPCHEINFLGAKGDINMGRSQVSLLNWDNLVIYPFEFIIVVS